MINNDYIRYMKGKIMMNKTKIYLTIFCLLGMFLLKENAFSNMAYADAPFIYFENIPENVYSNNYTSSPVEYEVKWGLGSGRNNLQL